MNVKQRSKRVWPTEWPDTWPPYNPVWGIITPLVWCCWSRGFQRELWLPNTIHSSRVQPMASLVRCHMLRNGGACTSICEPETKFVTEDSVAGVQLCPLLNLLWQQFLQCSPLIVMDVAQKQLIQKLIVFHWRCFSKIPQKRFKRELNYAAVKLSVGQIRQFFLKEVVSFLVRLHPYCNSSLCFGTHERNAAVYDIQINRTAKSSVEGPLQHHFSIGKWAVYGDQCIAGEESHCM